MRSSRKSARRLRQSFLIELTRQKPHLHFLFAICSHSFDDLSFKLLFGDHTQQQQQPKFCFDVCFFVSVLRARVRFLSGDLCTDVREVNICLRCLFVRIRVALLAAPDDLFGTRDEIIEKERKETSAIFFD